MSEIYKSSRNNFFKYSSKSEQKNYWSIERLEFKGFGDKDYI